MTEHDRDHAATGVPAPDALAALIRAAGRRPMPTPEEYERVRAASRAAWHAQISARRRRLAYALAAGVAVLAIGLSTLSLGPEPAVARAAILQGRVESFEPRTNTWAPLAAGAAIAKGTRLRTVGDGRASFDLPDGASLRAGDATEWRLAGDARIELTAGTLYVDSGAGAARDRVEIVTESGVVRDVGTQFEVRALSTGLRVRVREGLAELETSFGSRSVATAAGEQLSVDARGVMQRRSIAADDAEWEWTQALASAPPMDGRSAFELLTWISRETGKRVQFADAEAELRARSALLHGSGAGLLPLELLDVLIATTGELGYSLGEQTITVRER